MVSFGRDVARDAAVGDFDDGGHSYSNALHLSVVRWVELVV